MVLSKELLCILVAHGVAKLPKVKVGGKKKSGTPTQATLDWCISGKGAKFFGDSVPTYD